MKLLSICIPTYNRAEFLSETLDSILSQWRDGLEITISDNASDDETSLLVKNYQKQCSELRYFRWEKNQGADRNYIKSVEIATGKYCLILGSDDTLSEHSINELFNLLMNESIDIVLFNRFLCSRKMVPIKEDRFLGIGKASQKEFRFNEPGELESYFRKSKSICASFSYISSFVFKRESWEGIATNELFIGTAYVHVQKLLGICELGARLLYVNKSLVNCRLGNDAFRELGIARRVLLDLNGYSMLAEHCFSSEHKKCADELKKIVLLEYPFGRLLRYQGVLKSDPLWPQIIKILQNQYSYPKWKIKAALFLGRSYLLVRLSFILRDLFKL